MPAKLSPTPAYSSNIEIYGELDSAGLTPRTPHFRHTGDPDEVRSRRAAATPVNEPISEDDDGNLDEVDLLQTQSHPLLHSSTSDSFPIRRSSKGSRHTSGGKGVPVWQSIKEKLAKDRLPIGLIIGCAAALLLLFLIVVSIKRPDTLLDYMGVNTTAIAYEALDEESKLRFNGSSVIDYHAAGYISFPLTTDQYISECWKVVNDPNMGFYKSYWASRPGTELDVLHKAPTSTPKTCKTSITYLLDGTVGLMGDLAHLAQVAKLAHEQNRTLFVYDKYWNRGRWTDHFLPFSETLPGPEPGCAPPPPEELVACPRTSRHWITSARIDFFHLGGDFEEEFEDPYKYTIERKKPVFDRAAESFAGFIWPSISNQKLIERARDEFAGVAELKLNDTKGEYLSVHIRRGDRKAMSWRFQKLPKVEVPTPNYVAAVWKTYAHLVNLSDENVIPSYPPLVYLASDSPSAASEFTELLIANDTLVQKYDNNVLTPIVYELRTSSFAELRNLAPAQEYVQAEWSNRTQEDRIKETRGVVVDWALLSGAWTPQTTSKGAGDDVQIKPAAAICTLPSNICKLVAVGLGWKRAFDLDDMDPGPDRRWVEIDNHGSIAPLWKGFELFT